MAEPAAAARRQAGSPRVLRLRVQILSRDPELSVSFTGLLGEEASRLWRKIAAEGKRFRRKVVWQPCSAQREECHGVEKNFDVFSHLKSAVNVTFVCSGPRAAGCRKISATRPWGDVWFPARFE